MAWRNLFSNLKNPSEIKDSIRRNAIPLQRDGPSAGPMKHSWNPKSYDTLLEAVGESKVVMIGEASHGTYDFYKERAEITKRLIIEKGFNCVAVEADWPDAYKINRYIWGQDGDQPSSALSEFQRFPRWMWRNEVMLEFVDWCRKYNDSMREDSKKVEFYGLDLYSMFESAHEVISYLKTADPELAKKAQDRYNCFEKYGSTQRYGYAALNMSKSCEDCVNKQLKDMVGRYARFESNRKDGVAQLHEEFYAKMNAKLVKDAEEYYRLMFTDDTWNLRDAHMTNTLKEILEHSNTSYPSRKPSRAVVWAHNSHLGDAGATDASLRGETNVGELTRKAFGIANTFNIGFSTYTGTVTAAHEWDEDSQTMNVKHSLSGSNEELLHNSDLGNFYLIFRSNSKSVEVDHELFKEFQKKRPERFIGVIYRPKTERQSHYYDCRLSNQFDAVIHIDTTRALRPMDARSELKSDEQETYPTGL